MDLHAFDTGKAGGPESPAQSAIPECGVYMGRVMHRRLKPFGHRLDYGVFSLFLDIDRVEEIALGLRLFAYNRWGIVSFHDRDHGAADGSPLRPWVEACLAERGIDWDGGAIRLLCFPRLWGYVFTPLSIYYCYDKAERPVAIVYEVRNTFGEKHAYVLPVTDHDRGGIDQAAEKVFHVSPFIEMGCRYRFRLSHPGETLKVLIRQSDGEGAPLLVASHLAVRRAFTDRSLAHALLRYPLMTIKVIAAIHWEALKLWIKGARFHRKPPPPAREVSG